MRATPSGRSLLLGVLSIEAQTLQPWMCLAARVSQRVDDLPADSHGPGAGHVGPACLDVERRVVSRWREIG
jgi:hypothetical protein